MKHEAYFNTFMTDHVNLSQSRLGRLESQANAVYSAVKGDPDVGPRVIKMIPQGSWAHETIINPVNGHEVDADILIKMKEEPDWSNDPKQYINAVYHALHVHPTYKNMPHGRKCRCVYVNYANDTHVDTVPYVIREFGGKSIINRDDNQFEPTDPEGFTAWMKDKDKIANGNLRRVIRLMKYLRDHKGSFNGVKSILLTTLLGEQVEEWRNVVDPGYCSDLPTALLHIVTDLNAYLQANWIKPTVADPSRTGVNFDHRWTQETYSNFRGRLNTIAGQINDAYEETNHDRSVTKWQNLFGDKFRPPVNTTSSSGGRFSIGDSISATGATITSTGRTGRAG